MRAKSLLISTFIFVLAMCGLPRHTFAQVDVTGEIVGTVTDKTGAVVPDAQIIIAQVSTGFQRRTATNQDGLFIMRFLQPGRYTLKVEREGFRPVTVENLVLTVNRSLNVPVVLEVSGVVETITVQGESQAPEVTSAAIKHVVVEEQIRDLPIFAGAFGRSVLDRLPLLVPGVTPTSVTNDLNVRGGSYSVNGARPETINFTINGGDNNDQLNGAAASVAPNPDVIGEFTVVTNNYKAEAGRSIGALINVATKAGGNDLNGNVRYFSRQRVYNARDFFDAARPAFNVNLFGGQIGGPVSIPGLYSGRDRTFFFFDYEGSRRKFGATNRAIVPTMLERQGDFSQSTGQPIPRDPATGQPFPNNRVPVNPIARWYIDHLLPPPNNGPNEFLGVFSGSNSVDQFTLRNDQKLSDKASLSTTYFFDDERNVTPATGGTFRTDLNNTRSQNLILNYTRTFTPRVLNQFSFAYNRLASSLLLQNPEAIGTNPRDIGFTGVHALTSAAVAPPTINILDPFFVALAGVQVIRRSIRSTVQLKDDLSLIYRTHNLKMGMDMRQFILDDLLGSGPSGTFNFSRATSPGTGNGYADFLLGRPNIFSQSAPAEADLRQTYGGAYLQDDWRIRPNLTLSAGLRYEIAPPVTDKFDRLGAFRPGAKSTRIPAAPAGLIYPGDQDPAWGQSLPRGVTITDKNNWAPRFGLAYSPAWNQGALGVLAGGPGKTSFRLGYGTFYEIGIAFLAVTNAFIVPPFATNVLLTNATLNSVGGDLANPYGSSMNPFLVPPESRPFPSTIRLVVPHVFGRNPYTHQWNLSLQRQLPSNVLLEISYVGSSTIKLRRFKELNVRGADGQLRYPAFISIFEAGQDGTANYNGLQIQVTRRFAHGLTLQSSYVWSKALDSGSTESRFVTSGGNLDRGRTDFDRRHNFVASYVWPLPLPKLSGVGGRLLEGWQIAGVTSFRSGLPLNIVQSIDPTGLGVLNNRPDIVGPFVQLDPRQVRRFVLPNGTTRTANFFFDPTAFRSLPATARRQGTLGRNVFSGPGINNWDFNIMKRISVTEKQVIEFRIDFGNLFNHTQFGAPTTDASSSNFGRVTSTSSGRRMQLALKYAW